MLPALARKLKRFIDDEITIDAIPDAYARLMEGKAKGLKTIILMA